MDSSEQIARLRDAVLAHKRQEWNYGLDVSAVVAHRSLRASDGVSPWQLCRGTLTRDFLAAMQFELAPFGILAGRILRSTDKVSETALSEALKYIEVYPCRGTKAAIPRRQ